MDTSKTTPAANNAVTCMIRIDRTTLKPSARVVDEPTHWIGSADRVPKGRPVQTWMLRAPAIAP